MRKHRIIVETKQNRDITLASDILFLSLFTVPVAISVMTRSIAMGFTMAGVMCIFCMGYIYDLIRRLTWGRRIHTIYV